MVKAKPRIVVKKNPYKKTWEVWLKNGVQSFRFAYEGTRAECLWYKKMLKKAGVG
jgi:hypothetical protein